MKAITKHKYGGPEVLRLEEIEQPTIKADHVLIKVRANSANPADWHIMRGKPTFIRLMLGLFKPKEKVLGADFAGTVEEVGEGVTKFRIGDRVFGEMLQGGAFAAYICAPEKVCAKMPIGTTFAEMASLPIAGVTAFQALITHGALQAGESVLINGASGGVGHLSVQIAKAYGAKVTAVCSSRNVDFVRSQGADEVIAYDKNDIHKLNGSYDLVLDNHGNLRFSDFKRMGKRGVMVGFTTMRHMALFSLQKSFSKYPLTQFTAEIKHEDLRTLASLVEAGKIKPHLENVFPYTEIPAAIAHIETMRTRGKVAMSWP